MVGCRAMAGLCGLATPHLILHRIQWRLTIVSTRRLSMVICDRLRELRETKNLSQGDIEKRTGLLRCYISRVENGHTVPAVETLEKFARALEVPLYQLFYEGEKLPQLPNLRIFEERPLLPVAICLQSMRNPIRHLRHQQGAFSATLSHIDSHLDPSFLRFQVVSVPL